jgi:hypothetical protein
MLIHLEGKLGARGGVILGIGIIVDFFSGSMLIHMEGKLGARRV